MMVGGLYLLRAATGWPRRDAVTDAKSPDVQKTLAQLEAFGSEVMAKDPAFAAQVIAQYPTPDVKAWAPFLAPPKPKDEDMRETHGRDQSYSEYLRDLTTAWQQGKPQETRDQHTAFGDAESERAKYLDEIQNAWKRKPARVNSGETPGFPSIPQPTSDQPPTGHAAAQTYAEYCADISNAWRRRA
jgi:hypothetical protein